MCAPLAAPPFGGELASVRPSADDRLSNLRVSSSDQILVAAFWPMSALTPRPEQSQASGSPQRAGPVTALPGQTLDSSRTKVLDKVCVAGAQATGHLSIPVCPGAAAVVYRRVSE